MDLPKQTCLRMYDIHSPLVPDQEAVERRIRRALEAVDRRRLWVNPDCGLKTRTWDQVRPSLANLVAAAKKVREEIGQ